MDFSTHILNLLNAGKDVINNNPKLIGETGLINTKGDKTIAMDAKIDKLFLEYIKSNHLPVKVYSEEIGIVDVHPNPEYILSFDPLDGSTNYKVGNDLFPYGFLIAVYKGLNPQLKDVIAAGALEIINDLGFVYGNGITTDITGNTVKLKQDWPVQLSTPIYVDLYRKMYYETYFPLAEKLYIRNTGSTIGNLTILLSNVAAGMGHPRIKAEEIGAVYGLIKGAGGEAVNHLGQDIGNETFNFSGQYQMVAGSKNITDFMVNQIKPA